MATTTTNIGLTKPATSESASILVINDNMDTIDTKMGAVGNTSLQSQVDTLNSRSDPLVGSGKAWIANADLNDYITTGMYYFSTGTKIGGTADSAFNWCMLVVFAGKSDTLTQSVYRSDGTKISTRQFRNNAWTSFVTLYDEITTLNSNIANIVKTNTWTNLVANCHLIIVTARWTNVEGLGMSIVIPVSLLSTSIRYWQVSDAYNGGTDTHFQVACSTSGYTAKVFTGSTEQQNVDINLFGI